MNDLAYFNQKIGETLLMFQNTTFNVRVYQKQSNYIGNVKLVVRSQSISKIKPNHFFR